MTMRRVFLHGFLKEKYKRDYVDLKANTPYMLTQGLACVFGPGFKQDIRENNWHLIKGDVAGTDDIGNEEITMSLGDAKDIHFVPAVAGNSAVVRVVIGVALVVVGYIYAQPWLMQLGAALAFGGLAEMLTKPPTTDNKEGREEKPSFLMNGTINVMEQGGPVKLVIGRVGRAGTTVISAGIFTEQLMDGAFPYEETDIPVDGEVPR